MDPAILIGVLAGVMVIAMVFGIRALMAAPRDQVLDRIERVTGGLRQTAERLEHGARRALLPQILAPLSAIAKPKEEKELSKVRAKLVHAGFRGERTLEVFFGTKIALTFSVLLLLLLFKLSRPDPIKHFEWIAIAFGAVSWLGPELWLSSRVKDRQTELSKALPDTLDLIVTCVEAGLGVEAAIHRVAEETGLSSPLLATELKQTTNEINAGLGRAEAFRKLADRTGLDELRNLSATLIQTEMFGTSIAGALRVHSDSMRVRRMHLAEEKGATVAVKMMLPLIMFILPSLFAVILGPAVVRIVHTFIRPH